MSTILRATDSAGFLGIVPTLAGFTPRRSIVLLPFRGSRSHGAMRLDLPDTDTDFDDYADTVIRLVARVDGTDAVAVVVYSDDQAEHTRDGVVLPHCLVVDAIIDRAEECGLRLVDALCVLPDGWSSYLHEEPTVHALAEIPAAPEVPGAVALAEDQGAGAELPSADLAEKERVGRALLDLDGVLHREALGRPGGEGRENPQALAAAVMLDDVPAFFEEVLDAPENLPPFATAALLWCLNRPTYRDVALLQWATGPHTGEEALAAQLAFTSAGVFVPDELGEVFLGRGRRPDPDRLLVALTVARNCAARAPRNAQAGALVAAAWLSWALGRSTHAAHYLHLVSAIDEHHRLARLLSTMIDAAVLPEWTFRRTAD